MPASYPAEIEIALKHASVAELMAQVDRVTPIDFNQTDAVGWSSSTAGEATIINYSSTRRPVEALAHELLHARLKNAGYRQYLTIVAGGPDATARLLYALLKPLDNELQHHRMAGDFQLMGLDLKHFYNDSDKSTYAAVRRELNKMTPSRSTAEFFLPYLSVLAPGGQGNERERIQLKNFCKIRAGSATASKLDAIEGELATWRNGATLDAAATLQAILPHLGVQGPLWVGWSQSFPDDGFFWAVRFSQKTRSLRRAPCSCAFASEPTSHSIDIAFTNLPSLDREEIPR